MNAAEVDKCICQAKMVCYCGRELELWQDDINWYEGCKACNAIYRCGIIPSAWRAIYE